MTLERPRLKRRASAQHQHDISNDLLAEQNSMIGSGGVTQRLHVQDAESDHQPPHCNVETSRPLGLLEVSGGWGCLRAHFPYPASTIIQLTLILCGDCMEILLARPSIFAVNHHSERSDGYSHCQLINPTVETPLSTAAIGGRYFTMAAVESSQGMQTRCVPVSRYLSVSETASRTHACRAPTLNTAHRIRKERCVQRMEF